MVKNIRIKNKRSGFFSALFFIVLGAWAQQTYFQQEVNYTMRVRLNDEKHSLSAFQEIQYINNSSSTLDFIYFHLWPNAYKNSSTALGKQLLASGKTDLFFSLPEERGFIDSLNFKVKGKSIRWELDKEHIDICKLFLDQVLKPGDSITISTPFYVKIPDAKFSRLGHTGQAYFMTQWYPKPAVFDNSGWHQMPYLDQGEFYSEFGSFDVSISLPANYLVAATGDRMDPDEEDSFLNRKVAETMERMDKKEYNQKDLTFPISSQKIKTLRFVQHRVHDFAWFADKRFNVLHDQIELPTSRRTVDTWIFFTNKNFNLWKDAISYVNESTLFYSHLNGDYPYNHVTAIDGTIMAGGGMEYPNITVIGDASSAFELDMVITHEVGHNWFYGILGSNERDYPMMDEGINSFYELRYVRAKYPEKKLTEFIGRDTTFKLFGVNKIPVWRYHELGFFTPLKARNDQPLNLKAADYTEANYGCIVYSKSALIFDYLCEYMGEKSFDDAMKFYFEQYKFKHPQPQDLLKTLEFFNGKSLAWFQNSLINSTDHIDYKIKRVKKNDDGTYSLKIKNKTGTLAPFNIYGYKNNVPVGLIWYDGFEKTKTLGFVASDVDRLKIDGTDQMPDINRKNNFIRSKGLFKKAKPLQFNFLTKFENPAKYQINYVPLIGANAYNGLMLGAAIHNYSFYQKRFEYMLAPMYAFNTNSPVGYAEFNLNLHPDHIFKHITIGAKFKSFAYDYSNVGLVAGNTSKISDLYDKFYKITPYIQCELKKKEANSNTTQFITYSNTNLFVDSLDVSSLISTSSKGPRTKNHFSFVNQLNYDLSNTRSIDPFKLHVNLQHTMSMAKISATINYKLTLSKKSYVELRFFVGTFLAGNANERGYYAYRANGYNGPQDYLFETNFVGRNQTSGIGFNQFTEKDGALKVWTPLGQTGQWLTSLNIKSPKLFKLPIKAFADVVVCDARSLLTDKVLWDAGFNIVLWQDIIDVYIPLLYNNDIQKTLELNNVQFQNRIRFTFNIHKLVPHSILQNNLF